MGGCFLGCFKSSFKDTKNPHHRKIKVLPQNQRKGTYEPLQSRFCPKQDTNAKHENQILIEEDKHEEQSSLSFRKKDTFDVNVKKLEPILIKEDKHGEQLSSSLRNKNAFDANVKTYEPVSTEIAKLEEQSSLRIKKKVKFDANVKTYEPVPVIETTEVLVESSIQDNDKQQEENFEKSKLPCYPSNHRYNNCQESDEELDELESEESYMDDEDSEFAEEDDFESCDETTDEISSLDMRERKTVGLGQSARERGVCINPMLNPVTNLDQWKSLKTKTKKLQDGPLCDSNCKTDQSKKQYQEVAVDASLSNWLVSSETTSKKATYDGFEPTSPEMSTEDRSIMGALTVEDYRDFEVSVSPRRSPSQDPDEMIMTCSVETYQSYSGPRVKDIGAAFSYKRLPNITSKYQEVLVK